MSPIKEESLTERLKKEVEVWFAKCGGKELCFTIPSYASLTMINAVMEQQKMERNLYAKTGDCFGKGMCIHFSDGSYSTATARGISYSQRSETAMALAGWR